MSVDKLKIRIGWTWLLVSLLVGCADSNQDVDNDAFAVFGSHNGIETPYPSNRLLISDDSTFTGLRIDSKQIAVQSDDVLWRYRDVVAQMDDLDGFGTSSLLQIYFSEKLDVSTLPGDSTDELSMADASLLEDSSIKIVDAKSGQRQEFTWQYLPQEGLLLLQPTRAFAAKSTFIYAVTDELRTIDGKQLRRSDDYQVWINSTDDTATDLTTGLRSWFGNDEILLADIFTTQSIWDESVEFRDRIVQDYSDALSGVTTVAIDASLYPSANLYEAYWQTYSYRNNQNRLVRGNAATPSGAFPMYIATPKSPAKPAPIILIQHGLNDSREVMFRLLEQITSHGFAAVAIDATAHGLRRTTRDDIPETFAVLRDDFGLWINGEGFDFEIFRVRDLFRHTVLDHQQMIRALKNTPSSTLDFDGNGTSDIDTSTWTYYGQSMGAIIGAQTASILPDIQIASLSVGGARLTRFLTDFPGAEAAWPLLESQFDTYGNFRRFASLAQTILERGDPVNYTSQIGNDAIEGTKALDLYMQFAYEDGTVPNPLNFDMAYQADLPMRTPTPLVPNLQRERTFAGSAGISGNAQSGRTAAFGIVAKANFLDGSSDTATHGNLFKAWEGVGTTMCFFREFLDGQVPTIRSQTHSCR